MSLLFFFVIAFHDGTHFTFYHPTVEDCRREQRFMERAYTQQQHAIGVSECAKLRP